jgi:hypothetical protein
MDAEKSFRPLFSDPPTVAESTAELNLRRSNKPGKSGA